jgi:protein ImuB
MVITATNTLADQLGITTGMAAADARAIFPALTVRDDMPDLRERLLKKLAEWAIRFSPCIGIDQPDGLIIDATGCAHLWQGEKAYATYIIQKLEERGYKVSIGMADSMAMAWGLARYSGEKCSIVHGNLTDKFLSLPAQALRLEAETIEKLYKLGLMRIRHFIHMPATSLRKRFGKQIIDRIQQAMAMKDEHLEPIFPLEPYEERLPCMEPIITGTGVEIALEQLLSSLCTTLTKQEKGIRMALFKCYAIDGKQYDITIETNRPSIHAKHLFKLFEIKLLSVEAKAGIELFTLTAVKVEAHTAAQENLWEISSGLEHIRLAELIDHLSGRIGKQAVKRYLPDEHHIPEKSVKLATTLQEEPQTTWKILPQRPLHLLDPPQPIEVTAPIPDYPPMLFRQQGKLHKIMHADGPERIEQEWWIAPGRHRDYYAVEDEEGKRYWLFRSGHYDEEKTYKWYLHGYFA